MNLVQLSNELEYLPKDRLAEMAQDPSSMYPPYLVLAEIQRRTQMEKMYAAAQPRPETTVAEEVVNEFAMTNPNAGISSMTGSAPTDRFSPESKDIPAPVLMQTAASGGLTGYANGGFLENRYYGDNDKLNYGQIGSDALNAASLGLLFVPGVGLLGLGARGIGAAYKGLKGFDFAKKAKQFGDLATRGAKATKKGLANTVSKTDPRYNALQPGIRRVLQKDGTFKRIDNLTGKTINPRNFDLKRASMTSIGGIAGLQGINYAMQDDEKVNTQMPPPDKELTAEEKELMRLQNEAAMAETKPKRKGLDDSALDLVGLGGLIMGARNVSDLGKGISDFATAKQAARGNQAQQDYYAASAEKARAETEMLPASEITDQLNVYTKYYKELLTDGSDESKAEAEKVASIINQLSVQLAKKQGIDLNTQASLDKNLIASFR